MDNIDEFALQLFSHPPKDPYTVVVDIETNEERQEDNSVITEILSLVLVKGISILYGEDFTMKNDEIDKLRSYMWSLGWDFTVSLSSENPVQYRIDFKACPFIP